MTAKRFDGGAYQDLTTLKRWDGASWVDLTVAKRFNGATWEDVSLPGGGGGLSVTLNTALATGEDSRVGAAQPLFLTVTTNIPADVLATAVGGTAPYTYAWAYAAGSSAVTATAPTASSTDFTALVGRNQTLHTYYTCTVTDSLSATSSVDVEIFLTYYWESGGGGPPV